MSLSLFHINVTLASAFSPTGLYPRSFSAKLYVFTVSICHLIFSIFKTLIPHCSDAKWPT
jgi:hypothetical protein